MSMKCTVQESNSPVKNLVHIYIYIYIYICGSSSLMVNTTIIMTRRWSFETSTKVPFRVSGTMGQNGTLRRRLFWNQLLNFCSWPTGHKMFVLRKAVFVLFWDKGP
jgi:hypothetical protein